MVLQENEIIYKYFSMSLYQKLPENAAVISTYIYAASNIFPVDY